MNYKITDKKVKIPRTLHGAMFLGIKDFKECLEDQYYIIDMDEWHLPVKDKENNDDYWKATSKNEIKHCVVCLAGSVIAKTFEAQKDLVIDVMDSDLQKQLGVRKSDLINALERIRIKDFRGAYYYLYYAQNDCNLYPSNKEHREAIQYCENNFDWDEDHPQDYLDQLEACANYLKQKNV